MTAREEEQDKFISIIFAKAGLCPMAIILPEYHLVTV